MRGRQRAVAIAAYRPSCSHPLDCREECVAKKGSCPINLLTVDADDRTWVVQRLPPLSPSLTLTSRTNTSALAAPLGPLLDVPGVPSPLSLRCWCLALLSRSLPSPLPPRLPPLLTRVTPQSLKHVIELPYRHACHTHTHTFPETSPPPSPSHPRTRFSWCTGGPIPTAAPRPTPPLRQHPHVSTPLPLFTPLPSPPVHRHVRCSRTRPTTCLPPPHTPRRSPLPLAFVPISASTQSPVLPPHRPVPRPLPFCVRLVFLKPHHRLACRWFHLVLLPVHPAATAPPRSPS